MIALLGALYSLNKGIEINEVENRKNSRKNQWNQESGSLIKTQTQTRACRGKKLQITSIRTERGNITTDPTHITKANKGYCKQFYHTNSTTDMRWTQFLQNYKLTRIHPNQFGRTGEHLSQEMLQGFTQDQPAPSVQFVQPQDAFSSP